jgi:hypothetical protein
MYAVARGLNAVISVAQGTEISVAPLGGGAVIAVGQALDPINDLIEQFSALMLLAAVAFGLQTLLIKIGANDAVSVLLTLSALIWLGLWWLRHQTPDWLGRVILLLLLVRFAMPLSVLASEAVYRGVIEGGYEDSEKFIATGTETARRATQKSQQEPSLAVEPAKDAKASWWRQAWRDLTQITGAIKDSTRDVKVIVADMTTNAERTAEHMIRIVVAFLLRTLVLPLLFLWLVVAWARRALTGGTTPGAFGIARKA